MKILFLLCVLYNSLVNGQNLQGSLLQRNGIDSTGKNLLVNIHASSCKNCVYLNDDLLEYATKAGYKVSFCIYSLAKEDIDDFKEENGFTDNYPIIIDKQLSQALLQNSISLLSGVKVLVNTDCNNASAVYTVLKDKVDNGNKSKEINRTDSIPVDTSYKFYSGSAAYLNKEYCLVMDLRYSKKLHKINMQTGEIAQQFTIDNKLWAEKLYSVIYNGDEDKTSKSLKARQLYIKKDRIFGSQEFEPENITVRNGRTLLSLKFHFPYIDDEGDTLRKNSTVLFQLDDNLQITNYWVASIKYYKGDFIIPMNTDMTPMFIEGDTIFSALLYAYTPKPPATKYNYAKFILEENHTLSFYKFLPFTVPDDKAAIMGDYNVSHMYLCEFGDNEIAGSYITFPAIYNLSANKKICDIELVGRKSLKTKLDSVVFAKGLNNLKYVVSYFNRYNDKYYIMQAKNANWNTYVLFDNNLKPIKTVYTSPVTKDEGTIFYTDKGMVYIVKFGIKEDSDMYILRQSVNNLFSMEVD